MALMDRVPPKDPWKVKKPTFASTPDTPPEQKFISDDVRFVAELLASQWSLGLEEEVNIAYVPEASITDGRVGLIYVYMISRTIDQINSVDYRNLKRTCRIGIKISNRYRDRNFMWAEEVTRILLEWRRAGQAKLNGWSYFEISGDNQVNNTSAWYSTTIEVKFQKFNQGINSPGFGGYTPQVPPAREIQHPTIGMRPFDMENRQSGVIRVASKKTVTHPEVVSDPEKEYKEKTIAHEMGDNPTDNILPHDIVDMHVESREAVTHQHDVTRTGYAVTEERPAAPEWEHRMFAPVTKKPDPNPTCPEPDTDGDDDLY